MGVFCSNNPKNINAVGAASQWSIIKIYKNSAQAKIYKLLILFGSLTLEFMIENKSSFIIDT